jgi:hypothetical protein
MIMFFQSLPCGHSGCREKSLRRFSSYTDAHIITLCSSLSLSLELDDLLHLCPWTPPEIPPSTPLAVPLQLAACGPQRMYHERNYKAVRRGSLAACFSSRTQPLPLAFSGTCIWGGGQLAPTGSRLSGCPHVSSVVAKSSHTSIGLPGPPACRGRDLVL